MLHWLPFTIYFLINCWLLIKGWQRFTQPGQRLTIIAAFSYLTAILILCLTPSFLKVATAHKLLHYFWGVPYNIIPFQGVSTEFYLNIIMTLPWGVLLYLFNFRLNWGTVLLGCLLFSLFIETNQFVWDLIINLGRLADVDDLITNTIGGLTGFLIMAFLDRSSLPHSLIQQLRLTKPESLVH